MSLRILFINPIGTDIYDEHMYNVLSPQANPDTELVVRNLEGVPKTPLSAQFRPSFLTNYFRP